MGKHSRSRRDFLRAAISAGLVAPLVLMPQLACGDGEGTEVPAEDEGQASPQRKRSRVVVSRSDSIRGKDGELREPEIKKMLDEAVRRLAGSKTARDAWKGLFSPDERVTIKVGCLPGVVLSSRPEVARTVAEGVMEAGVRPSNIIIWDRTDRELVNAGYEIYEGSHRVNCYGTDHLRGGGYSRKIYIAGQVGSLFSRILTERSDALVSVAVLKDHDLSGVTLCMKNFFGAIHNPNKYHDDCCDPYIAQLMTHPLIRGKLRLAVIDGTLAQAHRGPAYAPQYAWRWNGLIVSRDPVAADAVGCSALEQRRQNLNLPSLEQAGRAPTYIRTAEKLGIGSADPDRIETINI